MDRLSDFHNPLNLSMQNEYRLTQKICDVTVGQSVKMINELQGLSQNK